MELAVAYTDALTANHPFFDGNKRVAFPALLVFLRLHGLALTAGTEEAAAVMLSLASGATPETAVQEWVRSRV